jgi:hypothetical protein
MTRYYVTTRRLPPLPPVIQSETYTSQASRSLWPAIWADGFHGPDWERSDIVSRLQVRNLRILWSDSSVSAITSWE